LAACDRCDGTASEAFLLISEADPASQERRLTAGLHPVGHTPTAVAIAAAHDRPSDMTPQL
jgi:hypothetical protein